MSTENITAFFEKAQTDSPLAARISSAYEAVQHTTAQDLSQLAADNGTPFTAQEFLAAQKVALSDESLASVAGGLGLMPPCWRSPKRQEDASKAISQ